MTRIEAFLTNSVPIPFGKNNDHTYTRRTLDITKETNYLGYKDFFLSRDRTVILYGGGGAGKSFAVADKWALEIIKQNYSPRKSRLKFLVIRKTMPSLKRTCLPILEERIKYFGIPFRFYTQGSVAKCGYDNRCEIIFASVNNPQDYEKIKSITDVDYIWIEEASEITKEAYDIIRLRLRGGRSDYSQIILSFNPVSRQNWVYDTFFVRPDNALKLKVNIDNNTAWERSQPEKYHEYKQILENLKEENPLLYNVYRLGEWGSLSDTVYTNYEFFTPTLSEYEDYSIGVDFGFNNPTAILLIGYKDGNPYVIDEYYHRNLLTLDIIRVIQIMLNECHKYKIPITTPVYCDSAEPDRIEEIQRAGINVHPADKKVSEGIQFLQSKKIYIADRCDNTGREIQAYSWRKTKDEQTIDEPVKFNDHAMDALRYGVYTHCKKSGLQLFI